MTKLHAQWLVIGILAAATSHAQIPTVGTVWRYRFTSGGPGGFADSVIASTPTGLVIKRQYWRQAQTPIPWYCVGIWIRPQNLDVRLGDAAPVRLSDGGSPAVFVHGAEWRSQMHGRPESYSYFVVSDSTFHRTIHGQSFQAFKVSARLDSSAANPERQWFLYVAPGVGVVQVESKAGNDTECDFEYDGPDPPSPVAPMPTPDNGHAALDIWLPQPIGSSKRVSTGYLGIRTVMGKPILDLVDVRLRLGYAGAVYETSTIYGHIEFNTTDTVTKTDSIVTSRGLTIDLYAVQLEFGRHRRLTEFGTIGFGVGGALLVSSTRNTKVSILALTSSVYYQTLPIFKQLAIELSYGWGSRLPGYDRDGHRVETGMSAWGIGFVWRFE